MGKNRLGTGFVGYKNEATPGLSFPLNQDMQSINALLETNAIWRHCT